MATNLNFTEQPSPTGSAKLVGFDDAVPGGERTYTLDTIKGFVRTGLGDAATRNVGTAAGTVAAGNDARFTDARTPLAHQHAQSDVTNLVSDLASKAASASLGTAAAKNVPSSGNASATEVVLGTDTRLTDARQCNNTFANAATSRSALGLGDAATKNTGTSAGTVCAGNDGRLSDARTPIAHTHTLSQVTDAGAAAAKAVVTASAGAADQGKIPVLDGTGKLDPSVVPAGASNATQIQGVPVASTAPTDGQVLVYSNANARYQPGTVAGQGGGDMFKADNLSGLANVSTARSNLGLGTAAVANVPGSGNAAAGEVVKGNDTRLSDARTPVAHSHTLAQISDAGGAAAKNVGTAAGTVAAGDHTHAELHTHANKTTLDKIGESAGSPTWNGSAWPGGGGGMTNPMTTPGDLIVGGTAGAPTRMAVADVANARVGVVGGSPTWIKPGRWYDVPMSQRNNYDGTLGAATNGTGIAGNTLSATYGVGGCTLSPTSSEAKLRILSSSGELDHFLTSITGTQKLTYATRLRTPAALGNATDSYQTVAGFFPGGSWMPSYYAILSYDWGRNGGRWEVRVKNGSAETLADTGITVAAATWYDIRIEVSPGSLEFYINDALVATVTTNIPSSGTGAQVMHYRWGGAVLGTHVKFQEMIFQA